MATERSNRARWIAVALAVTAVAAPSSTFAEEPSTSADVARAEAYAAEAFTAYANKSYAEAVTLYLKALEAAPIADILYNLARIYDTKLGDRELATRFYRRYLADPGADPERAVNAKERLRALRELDAALRERAAAPAEAAPAADVRTAANQPAPASQKRRKMSKLEIAGLATGLVGVSALAVGTGFGFAAKSDADLAKDLCDGNNCASQRGVDAANQAYDRATIATATLIAGGTLSLVGTALFVWGRKRSSRLDRPAFSLLPVAGPAWAGTQIAGRW